MSPARDVTRSLARGLPTVAATRSTVCYETMDCRGRVNSIPICTYCPCQFVRTAHSNLYILPTQLGPRTSVLRVRRRETTLPVGILLLTSCKHMVAVVVWFKRANLLTRASHQLTQDPHGWLVKSAHQRATHQRRVFVESNLELRKSSRHVDE